MTDLRFGAGHRYPRCVSIKREFQCAGLDSIVEESRGAVKINVINVLGLTAGVCERQAHRARGLITIFRETNAMISVASRPVTDDLSVDLSATIGCVFQLFENVNPRSLTEHYSGSISREGPRGAVRLIIPFAGQHSHEVECCENARRDRRIYTA